MAAINKNCPISKIAHGWEEIARPLIAFIAAGQSVMLQGMHGNAKTSVAELIGHVYGENTARYVDCPKANLVSMCGFPDMDKMRAGEQAFVPNNNSLISSDKYQVRVVVLDEISRAKKETSNELLELIEKKTIYGIPTGIKVIIATSNPDTYKGATKMDAALLDRFVACLPIPDFKEVTSDDVEKMIQINMDQDTDPDYVKNVGAELRDIVERVTKKYKELVSDPDVQARISSYVSNLVSMSKAKWNAISAEEAPYISGREASAQLWRAIIALAAYDIEVYGREPTMAYVDAARDAIKYCWIVKHGMDERFIRSVETVHRDFIFLLRSTAKGPAGKIATAYAKSMTPVAKLNFWEQHLDDITKHCDNIMITEMMSGTIGAIEEYAPVTAGQKANYEKDKLGWRARLYGISKKHKYFANTADSLEGQLICQLIAGMNANSFSLRDEPFKSALSTDVLDSSNITDLLVELTSDKVKKTRI